LIQLSWLCRTRKMHFLHQYGSHELKTPLTSLKGMTQLTKQMLEKQGVPEEPIKYLSKMDAQINNLTRLIDELKVEVNISSKMARVQSFLCLSRFSETSRRRAADVSGLLPVSIGTHGNDGAARLHLALVVVCFLVRHSQILQGAGDPLRFRFLPRPLVQQRLQESTMVNALSPHPNLVVSKSRVPQFLDGMVHESAAACDCYNTVTCLILACICARLPPAFPFLPGHDRLLPLRLSDLPR